MQTSTNKIRLLDEANSQVSNNIINTIQNKKICKVTGDNLDIYVRTGQQLATSGHKDLHFFASNIIFPRCASLEISNSRPKVIQSDLKQISPEKLLPMGTYKLKLVNSYKVLIGRILAEYFQELKWMGEVLPTHMPHTYQEQMAQKSLIHPLPIQFRNEVKHEDCVAIMDTYQHQLSQLYTEAFGDISFFNFNLGKCHLNLVLLKIFKTQKVDLHLSSRQRANLVALARFSVY